MILIIIIYYLFYYQYYYYCIGLYLGGIEPSPVKIQAINLNL